MPKPAPAQINLSPSDRDHEGWEHAESEQDEELIVEMEQAAQRDLKALLRSIKEDKLRVSDKTGFPTGASMKLIEGTLTGGDYYSSGTRFGEDADYVGPIKAFAWPLLLQAAKLASREGSRLKLTKAW